MTYFKGSSADVPATNFPVPDLINRRRVLNFTTGVDQTCYFSGFLDTTYGGAGLTVSVFSSAAAGGDVVWQVAFERLNAAITSDNFAASQTATVTLGAINTRVAANLIFTNVQIAGLLAGEEYRIYLMREGTNASDTLGVSASLASVVVRET